MGKWLNAITKGYAQADLDLQLKARFFVSVCFILLFLIAFLGIISAGIQYFGTGHLDLSILSILTISFLCVSLILFLLSRGRFFLSAHLLVLLIIVTDWFVIIVDPQDPVARLNSFVYSICILGILPLVINRRKRAIFIYGVLNVLFLAGFIHFFRDQLLIPDYAVVDFFSDNAFATVISCFIALNVFAINETALTRAKEEIAVRKEAEATIQSQKEALEKNNRELHDAFDHMAVTAARLEDANDRLNEAQAEILSTNMRLKESEEKFSKAFHLSPLMLILIDMEKGGLVDVNNHFLSSLEYDREAVIGKRFEALSLWSDETELMKIRSLMRSEKKFVNEEISAQTPGGKGLTLLLSSEFVSIGQNRHLIIVANDITERKNSEMERTKLEAQLRQAQKMEAVGHLAGGVAHDFNNMLSVVIGNTELIMMTHQLDGDIQKKLLTIIDTAKRSSRLVTQLLAFARKQTILPKVLDVNETISGMLQMLQRLIGENIQLEWMPGRIEGRVMIDPSQVDQILANLMVNARDAIEGPGKITIETQNITIDETYCRNHVGFMPGDFIMLAVSDNGCGMDKRVLGQIFEPFFTTKAVGRGTGLGLATVYGIVKQNGGFINVYSESGQGTSFKIYLPLAEAEAATPEASAASAAAAPIKRGSETILMVEDDAAILEIGKSVLEQLEYKVLTAPTPDEALKIVRNYPEGIDLLLTDVVMPQMNGQELSTLIGEMKPGIRTLFISGYTANAITNGGILSKDTAFLPKPFSIRELAVKVREVLATRAPSSVSIS